MHKFAYGVFATVAATALGVGALQGVAFAQGVPPGGIIFPPPPGGSTQPANATAPQGLTLLNVGILQPQAPTP
jgi:hypothetical protein